MPHLHYHSTTKCLKCKSKNKKNLFSLHILQKKCQTIEQLKTITEIINTVFNYIKEDLSKYNIPLSFTIYEAIPDIYKKEKGLVK